MKTTLLSLLFTAITGLAFAQAGRFTVTPCEVTAVANGTSMNLKTAIHLDTATGQAYFLMPLSTNPATWGPIGFMPTRTNEPPQSAQLRLTTNINANKISLLEVAPGKRAIVFEAPTNAPPPK